MQKFLIGTGRLTLTSFEYAVFTQKNLSYFGILFILMIGYLQVIEDFYRTVAQQYNVTLPHTLQSSIWINLAGRPKRSFLSFK
jgi:hypothetical protein